ncbi:tetratricopeptide repeat protein [Candidatus Poribacteria bacterium]|nr:tetratricopeptide repeat protein [Candidatus Poribacteria bacterium]
MKIYRFKQIIYFITAFLIFGCAVQPPPEPETVKEQQTESDIEQVEADNNITPEMIDEYARIHQISNPVEVRRRLKDPEYAKANPYEPTPEDIEKFERDFLENMYPDFKATADRVGFMEARRIYMNNPPAGPGSRDLGSKKYRGLIEKLARSGGEGAAQLIFEQDPAGKHYQKAMRLYKEDRLDDAIDEMEKALKIKPDAPAILYNLGVMYYNKENLPRAVKLLREALKVIKATGYSKINTAMYADAYVGSCVNLGSIYTRLGMYQDAVDILQEAIEFRPDDLDANCNLASAYYAMGDTDKATQQMRRCIDIDPDNAEAHNFIGLLYYRRDLNEAALDEFKRAVQLNPDEKQYSYNLGLVLAEMGKEDEAIKAFEKAEGLEDGADVRRRYTEQFRANKIRRLYNEGHTAMENMEYTKAIDLFKEVIRLKPDMMEAHFNIGVSYRMKDDIDNQIYHFQEAIKLEPDMPEIHYNLGLAYSDAQRYYEAVEEFKKVIKLKPSFKDAHFQMGKALYKQERYNEAAKQFEECLLSENGFEAHLNLGSCYMKTNNIAAAIEEFRKAIQLRPGSAEAHYNLGAAYMNIENYDDASKLFQRALELDPAYRQARIMLEELKSFTGN